jgi:RNA polymerase sigma-70 factor, ECF subfamily
MDVLGYSLEEVSVVMDATTPAVKAALHRGRARLRELAQEPDDLPLPVLTEPECSLLAVYVDRFNARDFDALRDTLAEEVRLDLVARKRLSGRGEVGNYFDNYSRLQDWRLVPGLVDGRAAALVCDRDDKSVFRPARMVGRRAHQHPRFSLCPQCAGGRRGSDVQLIRQAEKRAPTISAALAANSGSVLTHQVRVRWS